MTVIRFLLAFAGFVLTHTSVFASELDAQRNVKNIRVVIGTKPVKLVKEFSDLEGLLKSDSFKIKHPHEILNPKAIEHDYKGLSLAKILENAGLKKNQIQQLSQSPVSFIGRDGYTVTVPLVDALSVQSFISNRQSGIALDWRKGAPFLAFADTSKAPYLAEQSWWAWWVSAIVVGEAESGMSVFEKRVTSATIGSRCQDSRAGVLNYPRGRRKTELSGGFKGQMTICRLDQFLGSVPADQRKKYKMTAYFLSGQTLAIDNPQKYDVVTQFNGAPIPTSYGGPYQLCEREGKLECRYFLERIGWSE